jgi:hypothetical protein
LGSRCCRCRRSRDLWGLGVGNRPSYGCFWSCHCSTFWCWDCIDRFQKSCQWVDGSRCRHVCIEYILFVVECDAIEKRIDQLVYLQSRKRVLTRSIEGKEGQVKGRSRGNLYRQERDQRSVWRSVSNYGDPIKDGR